MDFTHCEVNKFHAYGGASSNTMTRILFVCHGTILKISQKACKINGFKRRSPFYYTTTTPLL